MFAKSANRPMTTCSCFHAFIIPVSTVLPLPMPKMFISKMAIPM